MIHASWAIAATDPALRSQAEALAKRTGRPLVSLHQEGHPFLLVVTPERLELRQTGNGAPGPLHPDFTSGRMRHRLRTSGVRSPLARAVGLRPDHRPGVLDATAGLGQDAFVLANLGCSLTLLERSLPVFLLLEDGLARAADSPQLREITRRIRLFHEDAITWFQQERAAPEVVYLDPMYPQRRKSALSGKGMRMLQQLLGTDSDESRLLDVAIARARRRVVVKRPARAGPLGGRQADFSITTPKTRYDIYRGRCG